MESNIYAIFHTKNKGHVTKWIAINYFDQKGFRNAALENSIGIVVRESNAWGTRYTQNQEQCIAGLQTAAGGASIVHSFIATARLLLFYVRHPPIISPSHSQSYHGEGPHSCYCISCNVVPIILSKLIACVQQEIHAEHVPVRLNYCI